MRIGGCGEGIEAEYDAFEKMFDIEPTHSLPARSTSCSRERCSTRLPVPIVTHGTVHIWDNQRCGANCAEITHVAPPASVRRASSVMLTIRCDRLDCSRHRMEMICALVQTCRLMLVVR